MSDKNNSSSSSGGIGFCGLLAILFITLKLTEVSVIATWSWWWVLSPLWLPFCIFLAIVAVGLVVWGLIAMVGLAISYLQGRKRMKNREMYTRANSERNEYNKRKNGR